MNTWQNFGFLQENICLKKYPTPKFLALRCNIFDIFFIFYVHWMSDYNKSTKLQLSKLQLSIILNPKNRLSKLGQIKEETVQGPLDFLICPLKNAVAQW